MKRILPVVIFLALFSVPSLAQLSSQMPYFTYGKGLGITSPDSLFQMNIRFRMQNRIGMETMSASDLNAAVFEARVRRLRLRLDGFVYDPRLTYVLQLSFSRGDIDFEDSGFPNIIRDAMVIYNFNKHFALGMGQTKLPGNRQRITSSGDLQLTDRSIVNGAFNIDRDFGVQGYYRNSIKGFHYFIRAAVSSGDGRNFNNAGSPSSSATGIAVNGLCFTGRVELLPFGQFTNNGDYFEGDLAREPKPKLSIAGVFSNNENAKRSGGQLGKYLYESRDIETTMIDILYKHNGWSFAGEFIRRYTSNPITINPDDLTEERHVYSGHGENYQGSYLFRSNYELTTRYSVVVPDNDIQQLEPQLQQYTVGASKYFRGHRVKLQTEFSYAKNTWLEGPGDDHEFFSIRFQVEVGI